MRFEWDEKKAVSNYAKHGVSFEEGIKIFDDPLAVTKCDFEHSLHEIRFARLGMASRGLLNVIYTERPGFITRIISARKASRRERRFYHEQERKN